MKKTVFKSPVFYWFLVVFLSVLLLWNLYMLLAYSVFTALLPIAIQAILLVLLFKRHEYARTGIMVWAILFLLVGPGLQLLGRVFTNVLDSSTPVDWQQYLSFAGTFLVGLLIVTFTGKTVGVVRVNQEETEWDSL